MTTEETKGVATLERLADLDEKRDQLLAALRIERVELRKRLEAIDEKLGPETRVKRPRKAKVEGEAPRVRRKRGTMPSVVVPPDVLA